MVYAASIYLLLFELIYKGLILVLFKPVLNIIVSLFIRAGGYDVLVNEDIWQFLFSFTGILMVVVVMILAVVLVYYEFAVILLILDSAKKKEKINLIQITETALIKLKNVIKGRQLGLVLYILVLIPILNIGIQSSLLPALSIPDFITGELAKYPGSNVLFFALGFILIYFFAKLFIVLPIMIFSEKTFIEAARLSFKTIKGEGLQIAFLIIVGMFIWIMFTYLPFMLLENAQFIVLRIFRGASNISMTLFTLLISPFVLSISLATYDSYVKSNDLKREMIRERIELGFFGKKLWTVLEMILVLVQMIIGKAKRHFKTVMVIALILIIGLSVYSEESIEPIYDNPLLIGHRGGEYGVENSMEALMFAGANGADYVEMDILLTVDNIPVVIHDNNLKRLGNTRQKISDMTREEVNSITIRAGGKEAAIPTLEELAREVKGKTKLLLEFKTHGQEKASIIDIAVEILEKEGILDETLFQTSDIEVINEFNRKYTDLTMGYVFIGQLGTLSAKKMSKLPVDFISAEESLINKKLLREAHKAGKPVFAWTINDDYKAERLLELGVDGIITDYPVEMVELRDKYKEINKR